MADWNPQGDAKIRLDGPCTTLSGGRRDDDGNYIQRFAFNGPGPSPLRFLIGDEEITFQEGTWVDIAQDAHGTFLRIVAQGKLDGDDTSRSGVITR